MVDEIWINRAISKTGSLAPNTVFLLKDLFTGVEWINCRPVINEILVDSSKVLLIVVRFRMLSS